MITTDARHRLTASRRQSRHPSPLWTTQSLIHTCRYRQGPKLLAEFFSSSLATPPPPQVEYNHVLLLGRQNEINYFVSFYGWASPRTIVCSVSCAVGRLRPLKHFSDLNTPCTSSLDIIRSLGSVRELQCLLQSVNHFCNWLCLVRCRCLEFYNVDGRVLLGGLQ